jgi:hypothetical protein
MTKPGIFPTYKAALLAFTLGAVMMGALACLVLCAWATFAGGK